MLMIKDYDIPTAIKECDYIVVGSGFFGATISRLLAKQHGKKILILEKRNHVGGNAYSYKDLETNIDIHLYGSHIFHTSNRKVWDFVTSFSKFVRYEHRVFSRFENKVFNLPINLQTLSQFFGKAFTPESAGEFLRMPPHQAEESFEDRAIATIGEELYEAFFKEYTIKQWGIEPSSLPASTFSRLPIRFNFDSRYFQDEFQGIPADGYDCLFNNILTHNSISIALNSDFFSWKKMVKELDKPIIYTGPVDKYFQYCFGTLGWRTLDLKIEHLSLKDFQGTSVINYPEQKYAFTRIHEFKHLNPSREYKLPRTVIMKEFSRDAGIADEPYYPINSPKDREILNKYREMQKFEKRVLFAGRLGSYQYLDMHMAIASAFSSVDFALAL